MKVSKINQFNHTDNVSTGFTLIELLVSISIMGVVFALAGTGITYMISSDQKLAAAQGRRTEVSHALDVISYDIRKAENVNGIRNTPSVANVADAVAASVANTTATDGEGSLGSSWDSSFTPVLFLKISIICNDNATTPPQNKIVHERVIYSTKVKAAGDGRVGPNILYRYGRIADEDDNIPCNYISATNTVTVAAPVNVPISDNIIAATTPPTCVAPTATTPAATSEGANGFYTCVSDNQVSIALFAKLTNPLIYGDNRTITSGSITSTATVTGGTVAAATAADDCEVPDLLTTPTTLSAANTSISTAPTVLTPTSNKGLSYTGIAISGGTNVISQTPSAGSKIPCKKGLVTYTY
jgi:prepilin-type N-terminal cleavage/methylation domain-containing protein